MKPNLFLVGAPKCGTTSLHSYLAQHPKIRMSDPKEPHFFGKDLQMTQPRITDLNEYESLFGETDDQIWCGEASVWYLYSKKAAQEILQYQPSARIVAALRNPADLMYSLHGQFLSTHNEDLLDFNAALNAEEDRLQGRRIPRGSHFPAGLLYRRVVDFVPQIKRYFDCFGQERVLILLFDDLVADTGACYKRILRFLELEPYENVRFEIANTARQPRNFFFRRILKAYPWTRDAYVARVPPQWRSRIGNMAARAFPSPKRAEKIDATVRRTLLREFGSQIDELAGLIKRDLTHWKAD